MTDEPTYKVVRFFMNSNRMYVVKTGLTLSLAQAHCTDPETSFNTCTRPEGKRRTRRSGRWFDGYLKEG